VIGRLRFSWKRNVLQRMYCVNRLDSFGNCLGLEVNVGIVYRLVTERITMAVYMKELGWI